MKFFLFLASIFILVSILGMPDTLAEQMKNYGINCNEEFFNIKYLIVNGEVKSIDPITKSELKVIIEPSGKGYITIVLPQELIAAETDYNNPMFLLIDGNEIERGKNYFDLTLLRDTSYRIYEIHFDMSDSVITFTSNITMDVFQPKLECTEGINDIENSFSISEVVELEDEIVSPLKQEKNGVLPQDVVCKPELNLIFKSNNGSPNCVKLDSVDVLFERDWAYLFFVSNFKLFELNGNKIDDLKSGDWTGLEFEAQNKIDKRYSFTKIAKIKNNLKNLAENDYEEVWANSAISANHSGSGKLNWQPCLPGNYSLTFEIIDNIRNRLVMSNQQTISISVSGEPAPDCHQGTRISVDYD